MAIEPINNNPKPAINYSEYPNSKYSRHKKILKFSLISLFCIVVGVNLALVVGRIIISRDPPIHRPFIDTPNTSNNSKNTTSSEKNSNLSASNNQSPNQHPFELPANTPFKLEDIEPLYQRASKRLSFSYKPDLNKNTLEEFQKDINPYFMLFVASMQYSHEKYDYIFRGNDPKLEDRTKLSVTVNQKCTDIGTGLTEETCSDIKLIGSINPFSLHTNFYVNLDHPDFSVDQLIDTGTHEVIHLLQYTYERGYSTGMPDWFKESMAVGLAYSSSSKISLYKKDFAKHGFPKDFKQMEEYLKYPIDDIEKLEKKRSAYYVLDLFWPYLIEHVSLEEYLKLIPVAHTYRESTQETEFNKKFKLTVGKSPDEIYENFIQTL